MERGITGYYDYARGAPGLKLEGRELRIADSLFHLAQLQRLSYTYVNLLVCGC